MMTHPQSLLAERLRALRQWMASQSLDLFYASNLNPYLMADHSQSPFEWFTGFEGSNGQLLVTLSDAHFFTDARYLGALPQELQDLYTIHDISAKNVLCFLEEFPSAKQVLGFYSYSMGGSFYQKLKTLPFILVPQKENPLQSLWVGCDQSSLRHPIVIHEERYAGEGVASKCRRLQSALEQQSLDYFIYTDPEPLSWLLNIRSRDGGITPVPFLYGIAPQHGPIELYVEDVDRQWSSEMDTHLGDHATCSPQAALEHRLHELGTSGARIGMALESSNAFMVASLEASGAKPLFIADPIVPFKAIKNPVEQQGAISTHIQDAVALAYFFAWLSQANEPLSEIDLADKLLGFRRMSPLFWGESFQTIAGFRENAALPHYHPTPAKSKPLEGRGILLVDSGGQYVTGTTDVTRTIIIGGSPTAEEKRCYTLVLKGHIALDTAIFPQGTDGCQLDVLARQALWQEGLDFRHATSHGVGHFLCVHEAPPYIGPRASKYMPLQEGMILSNEPAYYKKENFGIRIENMMMVVPSEIQDESGKSFLCFQTLTLVPLDRRLIDVELLSEVERRWVDTYHQKVFEDIAPLCQDPSVRDWLKTSTAPLGSLVGEITPIL